MTKIILLGAASTMLAFSAPLAAQSSDSGAAATGAESAVGELDAFTKIFENIFKKDDTPIEPAQLARGERVANAVVPKGSYRKVMAETFKQFVGPMMEGIDQIPLSVITNFAGVSEDDIKLKEGATLAQMMEIIDPYYKQRNRTMISQITEIMIDLSDDVEPAIRSGMALAYARRFSAGELDTVGQFFETESGEKFAGESLAIFTSPEVMSASIEMMPKFMEKFMPLMEELSKGSDDIPPPRKFSDLSDEELDRLSELMGIPREDLGAATVGQITSPAPAMETTDDAAWNDPVNWPEEDRALVEKLEMESDAAFNRYYDALEAAQQKAKTAAEAAK